MKKLSAMLAFALLIPAMVHAMTIAEVTRLSQSGVGDEVVLSQIDASKQVFTLTVDDILELKNAGVSDRVITYMINTGKHQAAAPVSGGAEQPVQEAGAGGEGTLDEYYQGYHDASANLYLSWGWGGYYSGGWGSYWPGYYGYYYPSYWCGSYYSYPYYCYDSYYNSYYAYNDGRNVYGRGGSGGASYQRSSKGSGQPGNAVSQNPRQYKSGSQAYGNRGSTTGRSGKSGNSGNVGNPSGTQSGRTSKPPAYSKNSSSNRKAPAPSVGTSRGYGGGTSSGSYGGGGGGGGGSAPSGGGGGRTSKGR